METLTTRELKQNPAEAIRRVLACGQPAAITAHGHDTGVVLAPSQPTRRAWVSGAALKQQVTALGADDVEAWRLDLRRDDQFDYGRDLWSQA